MATKQQTKDVIVENMIESEAAVYLRVRPSTMAKWRTRGEGPEYSKLGGRVVYTKQALRAFIRANARAACRAATPPTSPPSSVLRFATASTPPSPRARVETKDHATGLDTEAS